MLSPEALLEMFLDRETHRFDSRLRQVTLDLEIAVRNTQSMLVAQASDLSDSITNKGDTLLRFRRTSLTISAPGPDFPQRASWFSASVSSVADNRVRIPRP
jgi:hypothetical protein